MSEQHPEPQPDVIPPPIPPQPEQPEQEEPEKEQEDPKPRAAQQLEFDFTR